MNAAVDEVRVIVVASADPGDLTLNQLAALGRCDVLVNCAGIGKGGPVDEVTEAVWDANFDTNTKGTFLMCQAVAPIMKRQKWGRILNAASYAAITPSIGSAAYASSKYAVVGFTRVMAGELGPYDVTVNCYSPGMVPTLMNRFADAPPDRKEKLLDTLRHAHHAEVFRTLVRDVEDEAVLGGVEHPMQGDAKLYDTKIWAEVAAGLAEGLDERLANFLR